MFNKTYHNQYAKYSYIFEQFYEGLKSFYGEYPIDIKSLIRKLFLNITKIMFNLLKHDAYRLDEKCLDLYFDSLEPFGPNIVVNLEKQLVTSLKSVKIFTSGLTKIRDMIIEVYSKLEQPSSECNKILTRMTSCSICVGDSMRSYRYEIKPCMEYCLEVYKKCIAVDILRLDPIWNNYLSKSSYF